MPKTRVYISGKVTGLPYDDVLDKFAEAAEYLEEQGYEAVNPIVEVPFNKDYGWFDYMGDDIKLLGTCQAVYMLTDWMDSDGAQIEQHAAQTQGLNVMYQDR